MANSNQKGWALEHAVRLIEETVVRSDPALKNAPFEIRRRETFRVAGTPHEVDVSVRVGIGTGYESLHIFECKNWQKPVGKNDVVIFCRKIAATAAARG